MIRIEKNGILIPIPPHVQELGDAAVIEYVDRFPPSVLKGGEQAVQQHFEVELADARQRQTDAADAKARAYIAEVGSANAPKPEAEPRSPKAPNVVDVDETGG